MKNFSTGDIDILKETTEEKDLGVWMANTLKTFQSRDSCGQ